MRTVVFLLVGITFFLLTLDATQATEYQADKWSTFEEFKDEVEKAATNKNELVQQFLYQAKERGVPWIDGDMVTFIYYGEPGQAVYVAGDMTGWQAGIDTMRPIQGTNLYYFTKKFPMDARLDYKIVVNDTFKLDPLNPNTIMSGFGPNSELNMPDYTEAIEIGYFDDIPHGKIIEDTIRSNILNEERKIKIYVPHNYNSDREYPSLYVHDGYEFISIAKMDNILDYLIYAKTIRPIIAIFIPPIHREDEYVYEDKYAKFIVKELVPYIDDNYSTIRKPEDRATLGISYGGTISTYLAFKHPGIFGKVLSQSAPYGVKERNLLKMYKNSPKKNIEFYIDNGTFEWPELVNSCHEMRDLLISKGYNLMEAIVGVTGVHM